MKTFMKMFSVGMLEDFVITFHLHWDFGDSFKELVLKAVVGSRMKSHSHLLWFRKALITDCRFERIQRVFLVKSLPWLDHFEATRIIAAFWSFLSKFYVNFSI